MLSQLNLQAAGKNKEGFLLKIESIIISITIIAAGLFVSCDFYTDRVEKAQLSVIEAEREMGIIRSEVQEEIQNFRIEMAEKLKENNRSIAGIKSKINRGDRWSVTEINRKLNRGDTSVRVIQEGRILGLQSENREMKRIMDNYSDLSRRNWDRFKKEYTDEIATLNNTLKNFFENSDVAK